LNESLNEDPRERMKRSRLTSLNGLAAGASFLRRPAALHSRRSVIRCREVDPFDGAWAFPGSPEQVRRWQRELWARPV